MKKFIVMAVAIFLVACGSGANLDGKTYSSISNLPASAGTVAQDLVFKADKVMITITSPIHGSHTGEMLYAVEDGKVKFYQQKGSAAVMMLDIQKDGNLLDSNSDIVFKKQ